MVVERGRQEGSQAYRKSSLQQDKPSFLHEVTLTCLGTDTSSSSVGLSAIFVKLSVVLKSLHYNLTLNIQWSTTENTVEMPEKIKKVTVASWNNQHICTSKALLTNVALSCLNSKLITNRTTKYVCGFVVFFHKGKEYWR